MYYHIAKFLRVEIVVYQNSLIPFLAAGIIG